MFLPVYAPTHPLPICADVSTVFLEVPFLASSIAAFATLYKSIAIMIGTATSLIVFTALASLAVL